MQPLVRLSDVTVTRDGRRLLGPVSWDLERGRHTALVGRNGAGKTTLLRLLRGDLAPDPGGERVFDFGEGPQRTVLGLRERMGLVSADMQDFYLLHAERVPAREVVLAGFFDAPLLYQPATSEQEAAAMAVFSRLDIGHLADRPMGSLSTGQVRAVLLARSLAPTPDVLALDECMEGLDAASRRNMLSLLDAASETATLVYAAHRLEDVPSCISRVTVMDGGLVRCQGDRKEMRSRLTGGAESSPGLLCELPPIVPEPMDYLVRMRGVSVVRGGVRVLDGVDWDILPGERWLVTGANGAGKSTLLALIASELAPYADDENGAGTVERLGGLTMDEARPRIGIVSPALQTRYGRESDSDVTVLETVVSGFRGSVGLFEPPRETESALARRWLDRLGLGDRAGTRLRSLSYGQQRRVLLARAMAPGPALLLLDEPFAGLDPASRDRLREHVRQLGETGVGVVLVTHHEEDRISSFNRLLVLEDGRAAYCGEMDEARLAPVALSESTS